MNYLSVENISKSFGERVLFDNISFGINKDQKIAFIAKNGSGKTTIMSIINGLDEPDTGQVVLRKGIRMAFLSQDNNLQDELTIEESIFASDNETLKIIEAYEKALENPNDEEAYQKAFDAMDQHNAWDFETQYKQILFKLKLEDFKPFAKFGALAGMEFQKSIEQKAWHLAGQTQKVPAQRMVDFTQNKVSADIPKTSYVPGTTSVEMGQVFPGFLSQILREGFKEFGKSMRGYLTNEAILHAPESRTSSPVRIPRDPMTLEHLQIKGLYPCGEGAGYAGGIISAAIDGEKCALMIAEALK